MKKIFKILFVFITAGALYSSCDKIETGFDKITNKPDQNASYYLQFINAAKSLETGVTEAGSLVEIETPIAVSLMGMPQSEPITINLTVDPASTIASSMYTMSANSITIPAGKTSGSVTLTTKAANMPPGETKLLVLTMSAGEHNSPNASGIKLQYNLKRMAFCPLVNGVADLVGSWSGDDAGYTVTITTVVDVTKLKVSDIGEAFIADFWGESVISGGSFLMTVLGNGLVDIPRQYIFTTTYGGAPYDYEIKGSGKWENCGPNPRLIFTYDIYYPGDADGLAKQYASYLGGIPYLTADITLGGKKSAQIIVNILRPSPRKNK